MANLKFTSPVISQRKLSAPSQTLISRFDGLVSLAVRQGFRVDGTHFAKHFLTEQNLARMERLVFNIGSLSTFRDKRALRLKFIVEGAVPPELLREPKGEKEAIFIQIIEYGFCKACKLCIQVCPKGVYKDDGFGKPDKRDRKDEECTGQEQCGKCVDVCPDKTIQVITNPIFAVTAFLLLGNPYGQAIAEAESGQHDLIVSNPLEVGMPLKLSGELNPKNLELCHRVLDDSSFHPVFKVRGHEQHLVDSRDPEKDLEVWAKENERSPELVINSVRLLYSFLPTLTGLKEGKYSLLVLVNRIIDEIIHTDVDIERSGGLELLKDIINDAYIREAFFGAKRRPIGGILPPGTSPAWKTPYGNQVPRYSHLESCLGHECALCVTNCPEGSGGETSAIKMVPNVPLGTISSLVKGLKVFVLKLDGSHEETADMEDLTGTTPFEFKVNTDYCKACGTCMACCPHGVIEPTPRMVNLKERIQ